jgi:4-hydroxybenzoate polyprenyltransferase
MTRKTFLNLYIKLGRYDHLAAVWILFSPCLWVFALSGITTVPPKTLILFFLGSLLMRSAGCIINDMTDQTIDRKVGRTITRPLAKGTLSNKHALCFLVLHLILGFFILIQFNRLTIAIGVALLPLIIIYPLMKRWTYWAQLFLGITFNGGVLMAWTSLHNNLDLDAFLLYGAAILWTLGYDTIYGYQDKDDDQALGLKSTAVLFQNHLKAFVLSCFCSMILLLSFVGLSKTLHWSYYMYLGIVLLTFVYQVFKVDIGDKKKCLYVFQQQYVIGILVFLGLLMGVNIQ